MGRRALNTPALYCQHLDELYGKGFARRFVGDGSKGLSYANLLTKYRPKTGWNHRERVQQVWAAATGGRKKPTKKFLLRPGLTITGTHWAAEWCESVGAMARMLKTNSSTIRQRARLGRFALPNGIQLRTRQDLTPDRIKRALDAFQSITAAAEHLDTCRETIISRAHLSPGIRLPDGRKHKGRSNAS